MSLYSLSVIVLTHLNLTLVHPDFNHPGLKRKPRTSGEVGIITLVNLTH